MPVPDRPIRRRGVSWRWGVTWRGAPFMPFMAGRAPAARAPRKFEHHRERTMTVLITGATGRIGREVTRRFLAAGRPVRVLTRRPHRAGEIVSPGTDAAPDIHEWHPSTEPVPMAALEGVSVLVHLMGETLEGRWTTEKKERLVESRVVTTRKIAEAAVAARVPYLVSASSFAVYRGARGEVYDEGSPLGAPKGFYRTLVHDWEAAAREAEHGGVRVCRVRVGLVTGPGAWPRELVRAFARGLGVRYGDGQQIVPVVALEDAARMLVWAAEEADLAGPLNCVAPYGMRLESALGLIAEATGRAQRLRIPAWAVHLLHGARAPLLTGSYNIRPKVALARGFTFSYPRAVEAVKETVAAMVAEMQGPRDEGKTCGGRAGREPQETRTGRP